MKKSIRLLAVLAFAALTLCSCGKKDDESKDIQTTVPSNVKITEAKTETTATEAVEELIEINPFEGWELTEIFSRTEDGKIKSDPYSDEFLKSESYKTLYKNEIVGSIELYTKDGELCGHKDLPENETLIAKFSLLRSFTNPKEAKANAIPDEIAPDDEVIEYAKEHGILLTEMSREVVVKVAEETEE